MRLLTWLVATCLLIDGNSTTTLDTSHTSEEPSRLHSCENVEEVQKLLEEGVHPDTRDIYARTLLHYCKDEAVAKLLISYRADVNARDRWGKTPLHTCQNAEVVELMLKNEADPNVRDEHDHLPLDCCQNENVARILLKYGADVNARNPSDGATMLHECETPQMARLLLQNGADVNARDKYDSTPLHSCSGDPSATTDIARVLLEYGADVHARDKSGDTPLHECRYGSKAKLLLDHGANVEAINDYGNSALHKAAHLDAHEHARVLLEHGSNPDLRNRKGFTPLHKASRMFEDGKTVEVLLKHGANVMARTEAGLTPLHVSAKHSKNPSKLIARMLEQDLDIDTPDNEGRTALIYAMMSSCLECVRQLLDNGAKINVADNEGRTPLYFAITTDGPNRGDIIGLILDRVDVAAKLFDGSTLLHLTARWGASDVEDAVETIDRLVDLLRLRGFDVDILDTNGRTPLFAAIDEDKLETPILIGIVQHLLAKGASIEQAYLIDQKILGKIWRRCHQAEIDCTDIKGLANKLYAADLATGISDFVPDVVEEYQVEVKRLKKSKIYEGMSFYNFLHNKNPFIPKAIMDEDNDLANLVVDFPAYGNLLSGKIKLDSFRNELITPAREKLKLCVKRNLPPEIFDEILRRLTNAELWEFGQSDQARIRQL